MPAQVEVIPDGALHSQKPLSLSSGFEPAHLTLTLACRLMRDFCSVVRVARGDMLHRLPARRRYASISWACALCRSSTPRSGF